MKVFALAIAAVFLAPFAMAEEAPTQVIGGKTSALTKVKIKKDDDGQFFLDARSDAGEGFRVSNLGKSVPVGKKIEGKSVMVYVLRNGSVASRGGTASASIEPKVWKPGTSEKPGQCSGTFTVRSEFMGDVYSASGTFTDVKCTND